MKKKRTKKKARRKKRGFGGMGDAKRPGKGSPFVIPGTYHVVTQHCIFREGLKDDYFIHEMRILHSTKKKSRPVGSYMSWLVNMRHLSSLGNVRAFISDATGDEFDVITEEDAEAACSKENPLQGSVFKLTAKNTKTRAGTDFTVCDWDLIGDMSDYRRKYPKTDKPQRKVAAKKKTTKKKINKRKVRR